MRITERFGIAFAALSAVALTAGSAQAVPQFTPTGTELGHTIDSGESGTTWTTGGLLAPGQVKYTELTSRLEISAGIDALHFFDPTNGGCSTDAGSDCDFNFLPNLGLSVVADFVGLTLDPGINGYLSITLDFASTGGGSDITWTDPADGNSVMLSANWAAGTFQGFPSPGLQVLGTYCTGDLSLNGCGAVGLIGLPTAIGFAIIDDASPFATLFQTGLDQEGVILDLAELFDFNPTFDAIAAYILVNNTLPDFEGEANGQIFRVNTGEFVIPEPSTALLLGLGLVGLATVCRRARR